MTANSNDSDTAKNNISELEAGIARNAICQTVLSKLKDTFDLEKPDKVSEVVQATLETLAEQKSDLGYFLNEIRRAALDEMTAYTGEHVDKVEQSAAITVAELAVHWFSSRFNPEQPAEGNNRHGFSAAQERGHPRRPPDRSLQAFRRHWPVVSACPDPAILAPSGTGRSTLCRKFARVTLAPHNDIPRTFPGRTARKPPRYLNS